MPPDLPDPDGLYRALARIAPDPVIAINAANTILWVNGATETTFGYGADELIGHSLLTLIPERLQARHSAGMARYIATGERRIPWERVRVPVRASPESRFRSRSRSRNSRRAQVASARSSAFCAM